MIVQYHEEVKKFIIQLEKPARSKIVRMVGLLEQYGVLLNMPHTKKVTIVLYELRIRGQQEIRIFYTILNGVAYLSHGIVKKSQKIHRKDIETAEKRIQELTD